MPELQDRNDSEPEKEEKDMAMEARVMCELICLGELVGGFFVGILFTLLTLAVYDLRWSKTRRAKEKRKRSAHNLANLSDFQKQG